MAIIIVILIVCTQIFVFYFALKKIRDYSKSILSLSSYKIGRSEIFIPNQKEKTTFKYDVTDDFSADQEEFSDWEETEEKEAGELMEVTIVELKSAYDSTPFVKLINSVNKYLIKNKGGVIDFHIIKDIVERSVGTKEEELNTIIPIPLYLGLLGTFLGIIIGLASINFSTLIVQSNSSEITSLLSGVQIAMWASFCGLLLTTIGNAWFFKNAKNDIDERKNDLYTFLQVELLPVYTKEDSSNFLHLQNTISNFSHEFRENVSKLGKNIDKNFETLSIQGQFLEKLQKIDINKISAANVEIFKELKNYIEDFKQFSKYLTQINSFIGNTIILQDKISEAIDKTSSIDKIAENIGEVIDEGKMVQQFYREHFDEVEMINNRLREFLTNSNNQINKSIENIEAIIKAQIQKVEMFSTTQEDRLKTVFEKSIENINASAIPNELAKLIEELSRVVTEQSSSKFIKAIDELKDTIKNQKQFSYAKNDNWKKNEKHGELTSVSSENTTNSDLLLILGSLQQSIEKMNKQNQFNAFRGFRF